MSKSATRSPHPLLVAVLSGLIVGAPAGYILSGVAGGNPPAPQTAVHSTDSVKPGHAGKHHGAAGTPATKAFREASARMHADMGDSYTGDVDLDFAHGMVPHHQGAVDMARIELRHGTDPEMRALAQKVIDTQNDEIDLMRKWIARREAQRH